ncbi:hypothetical protein GCM10009557_25700 [Virgisporangium ochraceum]|uniref:GrpB family protein n=1 Tax=Virgisporangium ochraceum TaxID=65505 RepID=A0A8J4EDR8_9ACTN|nr:GrpB family protein [Virgisporangium ochraceum]GIJ71845.1 hypothetical protein Voc01_067620 [Virgisporangium ochraceum]
MGLVHEYDPAWPGFAAAAVDEVAAALDGVVVAIEHIGSTSVPGLAAKPVIDLMAAVRDLPAATDREPALTGLGYVLVDTGMPGRLFYRREGRPVAYHLHLVPVDSWDGRNERILRDHLLETPTDLARYANLKRDLAARGITGDAYTRAKTALIQEMMDVARTRRGLEPVPVWEE